MTALPILPAKIVPSRLAVRLSGKTPRSAILIAGGPGDWAAIVAPQMAARKIGLSIALTLHHLHRMPNKKRG